MTKKPRNLNLLKVTAERVGIRLISDLKSGKIQKITLGDVVSAVQRDPGCPADKPSRDALVSLALQKVSGGAA